MVNASTEDEYHTAHKYLYYVVEGKQTKMSEELPEPDHTFLKDFHNKVSNDVDDSEPPTARTEAQALMEEVLVDSGNLLKWMKANVTFKLDNDNRHHEEVAQNVTRHTEGVENDERHSDDGTVETIHSVEMAGLERQIKEVAPGPANETLESR
ncbi:hypothetical protein PC123_g20351 [Phytophthora cactorum]|nr:hypothetical protein PC123_g20351 [Phytophthora cactorum]